MSHLAPLMSSEKMDWNTPGNILSLVRQVGPIELDPCTDDTNPVGAARFYTPETDGLTRPWNVNGDSVVFCNPPYGREIGHWVGKMRREHEKHEVQVIGLVPARTDTKWWHDHATTAALTCFWRGRLKFGDATNSAPFPSAVLYWGHHTDRFFRVFVTNGWIP